MCWMTIQTPTDDASALEQTIDAVRAHEEENGHSWGVAIARDGELLIQKGVGHMPDYVRQLDADGEADAALGHTRYATRGVISGDNAHPFPVYNRDGDIVAALAHNGTWRRAPTAGTNRCDSYFIAQELEQTYQSLEVDVGQEWADAYFADIVRDVGDRVGETITVLHRDGRAWAYAGRFTITAHAGDGRGHPVLDEAQPSLSEALAHATDGGTDHDHDDSDDDSDDSDPLTGPYGPDVDWRATAVESTGGTAIPDGSVVSVETDVEPDQ